MLAEKHPAHPHAILFSIRRPTIDELIWLGKTKGTRQNMPVVRAPDPERSVVLLRFGLASQADLDTWKRRACGSGGAGLDDPGDFASSAGSDDEEDGEWE